MRLQEGKQYLVNRITFVGNTTTRDNVIRREMRLVEGSVFNTEALKYSVRRLNQLGYFEQINEQDQNAQKVDKTPGRDGMVDVTLNLKEQNRNQLTFGAGVSQYEGVFGQLAFQTANFLGRGESLTVSLQAGDRAQNYQLAFTEPFLFDRNITGGFDVYKRRCSTSATTRRSPPAATSRSGSRSPTSAGCSSTTPTSGPDERPQRGVPRSDLHLRADANFDPNGCQDIDLGDLAGSGLSDDVIASLRRNPFVFDSLLIGAGGRRTVSKVIPTFVHNTVDNPIFPNIGKRITPGDRPGDARRQHAVLQADRRGHQVLPAHLADVVRPPRPDPVHRAGPRHQRRCRSSRSCSWAASTRVRGFDIRSIGPSDPTTGLVLGGNKSLLFNAEYMISIVSQVRLIFFYDAGQVADERQSFALDKFHTSTGAEVRFFMPVLNVPFRLIFAANPQREGVLDNSLRPAKNFMFRFAVGSTF